MDDALDRAAAGGSWSVLLRHAERPLIPLGEFGNDLSITEGGRRESEVFGARIGGALVQLVSSPVRRCVETAEAIRAGAGVAVDIQEDRRLGAPGVWIADSELAAAEFLALGTEQVIRRQLQGHPPRGVRTLDQGAEMLLGLLCGRARPEGLTVVITHDAVIAPFLSHVFGCSRPEDVMPEYLEGAIVANKRGHSAVQWRGRRSSRAC